MWRGRSYTPGLNLTLANLIRALLVTAAVPAMLIATAADVAAAPAPFSAAGGHRPFSEDAAEACQGGLAEQRGHDDQERGHGKAVDEDRDRDLGRGDDDCEDAPEGTISVSSRGRSIVIPAPAAALLSKPAVAVVVLTPAPAVSQAQPAPVTLPAPQAVGPAVPPTASLALPGLFAGTGSAGLGAGTGAPAVGAVVSQVPAPSLRPAIATSPRDPELIPQPAVLVVAQSSVPTSLAAALAALPLLLVLWMAAFLRVAAAARQKFTAGTYLDVAAQLGIAPLRLAGLLPWELSLLRERVAFDELTGIMRRAGGLATLDREIARARRREAPLSIVFVDVDGLKAVNDARGHAAGDTLLKGVADVLKGRLRAEDAIFRYGGDEFCCILPDADRAAAGRIVDDALIAARARGGSFSVGLAQLSAEDDRASLLARADSELYRGRAARGYHGRG
jgi:diguanylate cyclase (GGDEF)-like protein